MNSSVFPIGLPVEIQSFCADCASDIDVINKLGTNHQFLITFFEQACNDQNQWHIVKPELLNRIIIKMNDFFKNDSERSVVIAEKVCKISFNIFSNEQSKVDEKLFTLLSTNILNNDNICIFLEMALKNKSKKQLSQCSKILSKFGISIISYALKKFEVEVNFNSLKNLDLLFNTCTLLKIYSENNSLVINFDGNQFSGPNQKFYETGIDEKILDNLNHFLSTFGVYFREFSIVIEKIDYLEQFITHCPNLRSLDVESSEITTLPLSIPNLSKLKNLWVNFKKITEIDLSKNTQLVSLKISNAPNLETVELTGLDQIKDLGFHNATNLVLINGLNTLTSIKKIQLYGCEKYSLPPDILRNFPLLEKLSLDQISSSEKIDITFNDKLNDLSIIKCSGLKHIEGLKKQCTHFTSFLITDCVDLQEKSKEEINRANYAIISYFLGKSKRIGIVSLQNNDLPIPIDPSVLEQFPNLKTPSQLVELKKLYDLKKYSEFEQKFSQVPFHENFMDYCYGSDYLNPDLDSVFPEKFPEISRLELTDKTEQNPSSLTVGELSEILRLKFLDKSLDSSSKVHDFLFGTNGIFIKDINLFSQEEQNFIKELTNLEPVLFTIKNDDIKTRKVNAITHLREFVSKQLAAENKNVAAIKKELTLKKEWESTAELLDPGNPFFRLSIEKGRSLTKKEWNRLGLGSAGSLNNILCYEVQSDQEKAFDVIQRYIQKKKEALFILRNCEQKYIQGLLPIPQEDSEFTKWIENIDELFAINPVPVQRVLSQANLNDETFMRILRSNSFLIDPFPENRKELLKNCSFDEFKAIVEKTPDLFIHFPEEIKTRLISEYQNDPSNPPQALVSLIEYPAMWEAIIPKINTKMVSGLVEESFLFKELKNSIETLQDYTKKFINWENVIHRISNWGDSRTNDSTRRLFSLGRDLWKLTIDEEYHELGPFAFDEGLHGGEVEPGFDRSIKEGWMFLTLFLDQSEEIPHFVLYDALHHIVMKHNKNTEKESIGDKAAFYVGLMKDKLIDKNNIPTVRQALSEIKKEARWLQFEPSLKSTVEMGAKEPWHLPLVIKMYFPLRVAPLDMMVMDLMRYYNHDLKKASTEDKLSIIAAFHQSLERIHMYRDGNSRTNLMFLQFELVRNGFAPALIDPNGSYLESKESWTDAVRNGMDKASKLIPMSS